MSYKFKGFETGEGGVSVVFKSAAVNSSARTDRQSVEQEIPLKDYVLGNFDQSRIGYVEQTRAAVALIQKNLDL